jgi:hypothetical protein
LQQVEAISGSTAVEASLIARGVHLALAQDYCRGAETVGVAKRDLPQIGGRVTVAFLGDRIGGVITRVDLDRRQVEVTCDDGESRVFHLSRSTGFFVENGDQTGARLLFTAR